MAKTRIKLCSIGYLPAEFDKRKIHNFKSSIFEVVSDTESYALPKDSDGEFWEYYDSTFETIAPTDFDGDFLICLVNVPLEQNWYSRRLSKNRVVFTFFEIEEYLKLENIPIENAVLRLLNSYTLLYKENKNSIPANTHHTNYTHDETRGCLFDMNGRKYDIVQSCHNPIICSECVHRLKIKQVAIEVINKCINDIKKIRKPLFNRTVDFIKKHPILALTISSIYAIILGVTGSVIASYMYALLSNIAQSNCSQNVAWLG